ncbi:MAG: DUF6232 family protein [Bacteroidota bacterium]
METTIYTDGHGVIVTNAEFIAGKTSYKLQGIVSASTAVIKASVAPPILLVLFGIGGIVTGSLHLYSNSQIDVISNGFLIMTANRVAVAAGIIFLVWGIVWSSKIRDRYAVHIVTAEGHKEPIVSTRKDYINQIVRAIQKALFGNKSFLL